MAETEVALTPSELPSAAENSYIIRPNFKDKFKPAIVKEAIQEVVTEQLKGKEYDPEQAPAWCKTITEAVKEKVKSLGMDRYKLAVNVVIGEQRGQGIKVGCRCFWDSDTDNYAQHLYMNETMFCLATAFGVFFY
ncbi:dynein light chain Tctex-type protein 2B-like [Bolinopsis microptera]|uniref:dynein light chain Tctex-type protein 2B-like n=1 Tax=Bolinopsis microptera TaxID=2820187 RepID=UPI003079C728